MTMHIDPSTYNKQAADKTKAEFDAKAGELTPKVLAAIRSLSNKNGASWNDVLTACGGDPSNYNDVQTKVIEEVLNRLLDQGIIHEPILGTIKVV